MLEFWKMWSTSSLPSYPSKLWPGVVEPDWVLSMNQIELNHVITLNCLKLTVFTFNYVFKLHTYAKLNSVYIYIYIYIYI